MGHTFSKDHCRECGGSKNSTKGCAYYQMLQTNDLDLNDFYNFLQSWSEKTFGPASMRGPVGPLKHLAKEVVETVISVVENQFLGGRQDDETRDEMLEEFADLQFLIFDAAWRAGFSYEDLRLAVNRKLVKNLSRSWPAPSADQPVEHLKEE